MVENLHYNAGELGSIPGQGGDWDHICHRATRPASSSYTASEVWSCMRNYGRLRSNKIPRDPVKISPATRRRRWHPPPVLLPGKSHGQRSLVGCSPCGCLESDMTERLHFHFHALEKEMAPHSSVLAWRIPGTGEPGGLPSMGSHRVRHD